MSSNELPRYVVPGSTATPSSGSTVQIYATIRRGLLDYRAPGGEMLTEYIGQSPRIYVSAQPEPAVFPYVTLRLTRTSLAAYNGYRETALLEVQAIGKPESQLPLVESAMDIIDQCLTSWTDARAGGLTVGRSRTRQTLPLFSMPAEAQTVGVIATYEMYLWPQVLTSRA
jgi:hypothetical protein